MTDLILHFDINGTITAVDSTKEGIALDQVYNRIFSKSVYGEIDKDTDEWIINNENEDKDPFTEYPNSISYYDYLRYHKKMDYKKPTNSFTQKGNKGEKYEILCKKLIESHSDLFKSFTNVLEMYPKAKYVFRTFGIDREFIIDIVKEYGLNNFETGYIERLDGDIILHLKDGAVFGHYAIQQYIKRSKNNFAIREDFNYWNNYNRDQCCGKSIIDDGSQQLFFDDNYCVDVRDIDENPLPKNDIFIKVNAVKAMLDENYYLDKIKEKFEK